MKVASLGVITEGDKILLCEKKTGEIGIGVLSGPGGKLEPEDGGDLAKCLIRETREELEVELDPTTLSLQAIVDFYAMGELDFRVYVYRGTIASGELHETKDMIPGWYELDEATLARTYEADRHWLPQVARGERFCASVYYKSRARDFERIEFRPFELPH